MPKIFSSKKGKFETRTAFSKGTGFENLPIEQTEREILCAVYDVNPIPKEGEKGTQLNLVKEKWISTYNPSVEEQEKFEYHVERLKRWRLLNWSGAGDWSKPNEVFIQLLADGFFMGMGHLRKKEADELIQATDTLLVNLDRICFERHTVQVEEKEVLDALRRELSGISDQLITQATNWLLLNNLIKIEEPGPKRGRWWLRTTGYVQLISPDDGTMGADDSESPTQQDVVFDGPPEEIIRFFKTLKDYHEQEMTIIREVQSRLELLVKQAEQKGNTTLKQDAVKWLSKVMGLENGYDLILLIQRAIKEHPEWVQDIVPLALSNAVKLPELPAMDRIQ